MTGPSGAPSAQQRIVNRLTAVVRPRGEVWRLWAPTYNTVEGLSTRDTGHASHPDIACLPPRVSAKGLRPGRATTSGNRRPRRRPRVRNVCRWLSILSPGASLCGVGRCSFLGSLHDAPASDGPETVACALLSAEPVVRKTDQRRRRDGVGGGAWPRLGARSGVSLQPIRAKRGGDHAASRAGASDRAGHRGACCPRALPRGVSGSSDECTGASCTSSLSRPPAAS